MRADPHELTNLAAARPDDTTRLRNLLIQWCKDNADLAMLPNGNLAVAPANTAPAKFTDRSMGWRWY